SAPQGRLVDNTRRGRVGGAAGNRTRVQSAYSARVYLHSPDESPNALDIGELGCRLKNRRAQRGAGAHCVAPEIASDISAQRKEASKPPRWLVRASLTCGVHRRRTG